MSENSDLLCVGCKGLLDDPHQLPCTHNMCRRCIQQAVHPATRGQSEKQGGATQMAVQPATRWQISQISGVTQMAVQLESRTQSSQVPGCTSQMAGHTSTRRQERQTPGSDKNNMPEDIPAEETTFTESQVLSSSKTPNGKVDTKPRKCSHGDENLKKETESSGDEDVMAVKEEADKGNIVVLICPVCNVKVKFRVRKIMHSFLIL